MVAEESMLSPAKILALSPPLPLLFGIGLSPSLVPVLTAAVAPELTVGAVYSCLYGLGRGEPGFRSFLSFSLLLNMPKKLIGAE